MRRQLSLELLEKITQARDISNLSIEEIRQFFIEEDDIARFAPDGICQRDPRNGDWVVYNSARSRRPHDYVPQQSDVNHTPNQQECIICQGHTTKVLDVASLSEGFTFINKNLYPIFYPAYRDEKDVDETQFKGRNFAGKPVQGYHFLQWTSSHHDKDWHNMPLDDRVIVLQRLAALEEKMLSDAGNYVSIIKNYGSLVGGSLVHGHQQIAVSDVMPNRIYQNRIFQEKHGETFSAYILRENPPDLVIKDYGTAQLVTTYFMRRPYDMFLLVKDPSKSYLHLLGKDELADVAEGWRDAIRIILSVMPRIGRETAYNVTCHNGLGAGLYYEFLPYTQEMGGFEHLGLYLCQGNPFESAQTARDILAEHN